MLREQIYKLIKKAEDGEKVSKAYNIFIMIIAIISVSPLMFKESNEFLEYVDLITVYILFADYILNWICYDYLSKKRGVKAFLTYPVRIFSIIDLVSLLPSLGLLPPAWLILRILRVFKLVQYSKSFSYITNAFKKEKHTLLSVLMIAVAYIFISALTMFAFEPDTFDNFFEALYWATTALTTVGYGDVYPVTEFGKLISMISSLFGVAIIALPAGIITASFVEEINRAKEAGMATDETTSIVERVLEYEEKTQGVHNSEMTNAEIRKKAVKRMYMAKIRTRRK